MRKVWYGWQTLIILGGSSVMLALSPAAAPVTLPIGLTGFVFGGPIVHWAHGHGWRGTAVLGMHVGGTVVGGLLGVGAVCGISDGCGGELGGFGIALGLGLGGAIGLLTTNIIDIAALSSEERPDVPMARTHPPKLRLFALPTLDIRNDRAVLGLIGSF